ncbi:MAG: DNA primase [Alphaproteobacteria bacterium]|nr:DNA primase [Alphaproteobacteria bacterium]
MAYPEHVLEDIRARVGLAARIGRRVRLERRGREHVGLCPFHNEKTPSFTVNEQKGFFHCFGCGVHGSLFDWVTRTEGVGFAEAVERLAQEAGVPLPPRRPADEAVERHRLTLFDVNERAARWFEAMLAGPEGKVARDYLAARGVAAESMRRFRLGYAPERRTALKDTLVDGGVPEALVAEAGLLIEPEGGGARFDRFRHRLMFPIADARGRIIAFGGRALGEAKAKYLNSPETPLFHKGRVLYGLHQALPAAREAGRIVAVEGYLDVVTVSEAGFAMVVAPLGTALTEDQIEMLWRMAPEPVVCLDGDTAGRKAAARAAERTLPLLRPGYSLSFAYLPWEHDPDSLVRQRGVAAFEQCLGEALPLSEVLWREANAGRPSDTPERRAAIRATALAHADRIKDSTVRRYYRGFFLAKVAETFEARVSDRRKPATRRFPSARLTPAMAGASDAQSERVLLQALLNHPTLLRIVNEELAMIGFAEPDLDRLARALLEVAAGEEALDFAGLRRQLSALGLSAIVERIAGPGIAVLDGWARSGAPEAEAERDWRLAAARLREQRADTERAAVAALAETMTEDAFHRLRALKTRAGTDNTGKDRT